MKTSKIIRVSFYWFLCAQRMEGGSQKQPGTLELNRRNKGGISQGAVTTARQGV
ncbi:hypothetical protein [Xenorhabdus budapestensis]|uniref:hypothetical protein n=1 Tax=Xenorhabdus budapestensis TaxID=290110 RepID=UPI001475E509|nr:hypothetical protein [Xenorhabdus budapestensis]